MNGPKYYDNRWISLSTETLEPDLCVYGGNAAGVMAAVTAAELGRSVVLIHPGVHLGGMTTGGLGWTDVGNPAVVGGVARRFYRTIGSLYAAAQGKEQITWRFEPSVARRAIEEFVEAAGFEVRFACYLDSVETAGNSISALTCRGGLTVRAGMYIDTTYEGDLMAAAGVPCVVGRESADHYGESMNGFQVKEKHQFPEGVDPYIVPGDPESGYLPGLAPGGSAAPLQTSREELTEFTGTGDSLVQAYNFRVCMSDDPENRIPFPKPEGYDADSYELCARWLSTVTDLDEVFHKFSRVTPHKTDTNNWGPFSTDYIGGSSQWPEASYERREELFQEHLRYQQGLHYFMSSDHRVPEFIRLAYAKWGLAADEFVDTGGWPHQLYVREGRRMVGDYVITQADCLGERECHDPVGMAAYMMDSHNCQRLLLDGEVRNEGDIQSKLPAPYGISLRSIIPPQGSVGNLAVPMALSASHIAFGSVRMEPVFMILAESAAVATALALEEDRPLSALDYRKLRELLDGRGQILTHSAKIPGED